MEYKVIVIVVGMGITAALLGEGVRSVEKYCYIVNNYRGEKTANLGVAVGVDVAPAAPTSTDMEVVGRQLWRDKGDC